MSYKIVVENFSSLTSPMEKLAKGMSFQQVSRFEKTHRLMFLDTQARVHVLTGVLKASGTTRTHFDGDEWSGEIEYLRRPGVFELARGDTPTKFHPEGGHSFFAGLEAFYPEIEQNIMAVFKDAFDQGPV